MKKTRIFLILSVWPARCFSCFSARWQKCPGRQRERETDEEPMSFVSACTQLLGGQTEQNDLVSL